MSWVRTIIRLWRAKRYATRFYEGYAFGMDKLEGPSKEPLAVRAANIESWLDAADHYGQWDAFDDGLRAALRDFDAKQRGLGQGAKREQV